MAEGARTREHGNAYNIFILVLTILSLVIMVLLLLPLAGARPPGPAGLRQPHLLRLPRRLRVQHHGAPSRSREYFIGQRGWLDLIGSIPSLGIFRSPPCSASRASAGCPHHAGCCAARPEGADRGRPQQPRPVRDVHHPAVRADRAHRVERARPPVRELASPGRQHHDRRRRPVVGLVTITTVGYGDYYPVTTARAGDRCRRSCSRASASSAPSPASSPASWCRDEPHPEERAHPGRGWPHPRTADADVAKELALLRAEIADLQATLADRVAPG